MSNQPVDDFRICKVDTCPAERYPLTDFCPYHLLESNKSKTMSDEERFLRLLLHAMRLRGSDCHQVNMEVVTARLNKIGTTNSPLFPAYQSTEFDNPYAALFKECYQ